MSRSRRVFDVFVSVLALLLLLPVMLAAAAAVKVWDGGPIFFRHERIGKGFRPFQMIKFRTMVAGAEKRGPPITSAGDCRVTRVGRFLRGAKIDELPQLFNVLKGEMSLVGPRPEVRAFVELFREEYTEILDHLPGITDPASVMFRHEERLLASAHDPEKTYVEEILPRKLELNRLYLKNRTIFSDIAVIVKTVLSL